MPDLFHAGHYQLEMISTHIKHHVLISVLHDVLCDKTHDETHMHNVLYDECTS